MTISKAKQFIHSVLTDISLRSAINRTSTINEIDMVLQQNDMHFTPGEFEEAFRNLLTQCQSESQANQLQQIKMWWEMIQYHTPPN